MKTSRAIVLSQRSSRTTAMMFVFSVVSALFSFVGKAQAAASCESKVAQIVSVQGIVELRRAGQTIWQQATMNTTLCPGDMLRVRARSRAALRLNNESMLRLDQKTTITFPELAEDQATSLLDLFTGALHILTRTPKPFKIRTPFVNAAVEGTEFFVSVVEDNTQLVIYEGQISVSNDKGSLVLVDHEAAIARKNEAPQKVGIISPTDAVQWALYYPTIIDYQLNEKLSDEPAWPAIQASIELYQQGRLFDALSKLDEVPQSARSAQSLNYYAGLLLSVGRVDEAKAAIEQAFELDPDNNDAYALKAIIAVVQNDKEQALSLATQAAELNQVSPTAKLALSYAQQAHFEIDDALASVQEAVKIDTQNALAWARLAELQMSTGDLDRALESARQAVNLNPTLAKTQTVLGFAHLLQIDTEAAKAIFAQAIILDQADPMPRLGLGLALIREGELEAGRIELEIAASLDPANSLIRSYLGKAYFEEKRYPLASTQFDMAKERDPYDPTPWFYDAIQKQTQNRPVEALQDIQKSIELNDNRAVYRSKLLLDQDEAGRSSSLARIYDNLGFEKRAIVETAKSLSFDPSNSSAHRFLSDTYANIPRHEIARVSELLQAQLLQPINLNPVQPRLAVADLNIITNTGPAIAGFNEFAPLMERNRPQLVVSGIAGSNSTLGNEMVFSTLYDRTSVSLGQFHHETDGFRPNNDQKHNIYNAFIQHAVTPKLNVQAEVRTRETEHGNLLLDFGEIPESGINNRRTLNEDIARTGLRYSLAPKQDIIASAFFFDRSENEHIFEKIVRDRNDITKDSGYQTEMQYIRRHEIFNLIVGGGAYRIDVDRHRPINHLFDIKKTCDSEIRELGLSEEEIKDICDRALPDFNRERTNFYTYLNLNYPNNFNWTFGFSYESIKEGLKKNKEDSLSSNNFDAFNPKLGLQWNINEKLRLRFAWFKTVKTALVANQTVEPTQVAGFNQFFDGTNGTQSKRVGIGLDAELAHNLYGGVEASARNLKTPVFFTDDFSLLGIDKQNERLYRAYLYWIPHVNWTINAQSRFEKFTRNKEKLEELFLLAEPSQIKTFSAPLSINYFGDKGVLANLTGTYLHQAVERQEPMNFGRNDFFLLDAVIGYRFPNRRGILNFEARNLLDQEFLFRFPNFFQSEASNPRFIPIRTFFVRLTLNF